MNYVCNIPGCPRTSSGCSRCDPPSVHPRFHLPPQPMPIGCTEVGRLWAAARAVCRFDWSGNGDDAVAAIDDLRRALGEKT
jgi:hypothetical protein